MKLIKVRDNQNRPVSGLDIMMGAVFGDEVPREFISGEHYDTGEHVYYIDENGSLKIWQCNLSGRYLRCEDPGFSEWSLNAVIQKNYPSNSSNGTGSKIINPEMYEMKSLVSENHSYEEYDGYVKFDASFGDFNLSDYSEAGDIVDIYLRREHSDHYLAPSDYKFDGKELSLELPLSDIADIETHTSKFIPEGKVVSEDETPYYWYGEDDVRKSFDLDDIGINLQNYDILGYFGVSIEYGYKITDLKVEAIHTVVPSPLNDEQPVQVHRLDEFIINGNHEPIGTEVLDGIQTISIPVEIEPDRDVNDTLIVEFNPDTQLINVYSENGYVKQVKFSLISRKLKPLSAFMIGSKAKSDMTKFIRVINEFGKVVDIDGKKYVKFPCMDMLRYNSFEFELYWNRIFRNDYEEYIDDNGDLYISLTDTTGIDWDNDTFLFHIYYCITQGAAIVKTSNTQEVLTDKDTFRIFLTTEYVNKYQWLKLREDSKLVPPEYTIGSKGIATITNQDHYLSVGQTLKADVFSLIFRNFQRRIGSSTTSCNSEVYPIMENTRELIIPFVDYDAENDDFLIFKSGGVLVSSAKWYLNKDKVNLYIHELPLNRGDYVDFRMLDRDSSVRIYNKYLTGTSDNQEVMDIDVDISNVAFFLLFTVSGQFISPSKYSINGSIITFNRNCNQPFVVDNGTRLEAVYGVYKEERSKTLYTNLQIKATEDNQKEFILEETLDYNPGSDNILLFREDGMYIGERFYHIDGNSNRIVIDKGSGVPNGSHIDVVVIRNLTLDIKVSSI